MTDLSQSHTATKATTARHGQEAPFASAMRASRSAMIITDARASDNPIIFANDAFLRLTGYERDDVLGRNCRFLQGADTDPNDLARIRAAISAGEPVDAELLNYRKDGSSFWNALRISPVRDEHGVLTNFVGSQVEISGTGNAPSALGDMPQSLERLIAQRTQELTEALEQKTALLHEVDHRVKNNLQLISSLLVLQNRRVADPAVKAAMRGMLDRVNAVATVHRRLFQNDDVEHFDVSAFVRDLVADLIGSAGRDDIAFSLDLERVDVAAAKAAPLALVISEILSNAMRHAFPAGRAGRIFVGIRRIGDDFRIEVADNGVGLDSTAKSSGFGLTIIQLLCQQLKAKSQTTDAEPGVRIVINLPVNGAHA